jgi:hypothetical protein
MITSEAPSRPERTGGPRRRRAALAVVAVLAGATLAALGAAAGTWAGWRDVPPMSFGTSPVLGSGVAAVVAPDLRPETVEQVRPVGTPLHRGVLSVLLGGERFGSGYEEVVLRTGERTGAVVDAAAGRLEAAGWTTERGDGVVGATRDGMRLTVRATGSPGDPATETVMLLLQREEPDGVLPLALGGAAAGALIGALGAVLLGRRGGVVGALPLVAVVVLLPLTGTGLGGLALRLTGVEIGPEPPRGGLLVASLSLAWIQLAIAGLVVAGVVVGLRRLSRPPARPSKT